MGCLPEYLPTRTARLLFRASLQQRHEALQGTQGRPPDRGEEIIEEPVRLETLTPRYTAEAIRIIQGHRAAVLFFNLPYTFPHVRWPPPTSFAAAAPAGCTRRRRGAGLERGSYIIHVSGPACRAHALVFITSDNGPWHAPSSTGLGGLLRGGKARRSRAACASQASVVARQDQADRQPRAGLHARLLPTHLALAGTRPPADRPLDGYDITPLLLGTGASPRHEMIFYNGTDLFAWRKDRYKLHVATSEYCPRACSVTTPRCLSTCWPTLEQFDSPPSIPTSWPTC